MYSWKSTQINRWGDFAVVFYLHICWIFIFFPFSWLRPDNREIKTAIESSYCCGGSIQQPHIYSKYAMEEYEFNIYPLGAKLLNGYPFIHVWLQTRLWGSVLYLPHMYIWFFSAIWNGVICLVGHHIERASVKRMHPILVCFLFLLIFIVCCSQQCVMFMCVCGEVQRRYK